MSSEEGRTWLERAAQVSAAAATGVVVIGMGPMPYAYYTFLRFVMFVALILALCLVAAKRGGPKWTVAFACLILLYNPCLAVHLGSKGLWAFLNLGTLACLWTSILGDIGSPSGDRGTHTQADASPPSASSPPSPKY